MRRLKLFEINRHKYKLIIGSTSIIKKKVLFLQLHLSFLSFLPSGVIWLGLRHIQFTVLWNYLVEPSQLLRDVVFRCQVNFESG